MSDLAFRAMGSSINLRIEGARPAQARRLLASGRRFIEEFDSALSRFKPGSELSCLNANSSDTVAISGLMSEFVSAALWAADASGGLVDPTLTPALIDAGYGESREGRAPADLVRALESAPPRRPARPDANSRWGEIELDRPNKLLRRPAGLTLDSGGIGKGLAADLLARSWSISLGGNAGFFVDCGGDIRFGPRGNRAGYVKVEDPFRDRLLPLGAAGGAVATTSIRNRIWLAGDGTPAHHLIDPATGRPAWTGLVAITALAPTAVIAETFAKVAFLRGPAGARDVLASAHGGLIVHEGGEVEYVVAELQAQAA